MVMRNVKHYVAALAVALAAFGGSKAFATVSLVGSVGDSGQLEVQAFTPTLQEATISFNDMYGSSPFPTITQVSSTVYEIKFTPSAAFFASANNHAFPETATISGELSFNVQFSSAVHLTTNVFEDGIWNTTGNGTIGVSAGTGLVVTETDDLAGTKTSDNISTPPAIFQQLPSGLWTFYDQAPAIAGAATYSNYHIVVDNDLIAEALGTTPSSSAAIAKKDFTIFLTTDGSSGGNPPSPEPASLGLLAIGSMALFARRRRA
jgi:hypothetical protein